MAETPGSKQMLNDLFKKYGLNVDDHFFETANYKIITRAGIDKIQAGASIDIRYEPVPEFSDAVNERYVVKAIGSFVGDDWGEDGKPKITIETFGEVDPTNYTKKVYRSGPAKGQPLPWYPIAMAEKRAMSRCVLKLAGFYGLGVFGEDEAEEFKETVKKGQQNKELTPQIKE